MSSAASRLAKPGDDDLDLDLDGVSVVAVVVLGREVLVRVEGGFGRFVTTDGTEALMPPGDPRTGVEFGELVLVLEAMSEEGFAAYLARLEEWRARSVPLRLCSAPGRMTTLIEDASVWLPMPRRRIPRP